MSRESKPRAEPEEFDSIMHPGRVAPHVGRLAPASRHTRRAPPRARLDTRGTHTPLCAHTRPPHALTHAPGTRAHHTRRARHTRTHGPAHATLSRRRLAHAPRPHSRHARALTHARHTRQHTRRTLAPHPTRQTAHTRHVLTAARRRASRHTRPLSNNLTLQRPPAHRGGVRPPPRRQAPRPVLALAVNVVLPWTAPLPCRRF